jgi:hypothetical protein
MLIQPKPYRDKLRLRHHAYGVERRRNMSKLILENGTPFPKPIEYSDIDQEMYNWVDKKFNLEYDGVRLPTYKLYSTQRLSEYTQTWSQTDDYGNMIMNFKTITRENNPQKGENQSSYFNIPGHKDFAMFYVPVLQENGTEAYDKYTMKQPFSVNFMYSVSIITNKMELLNEMNELMHYEFSAINVYVSPNDHPMPLTLEDISDQSEYTIDDRKYYSQTFKIKLKGYIIRREDYKVERIPSRLIMSSHDSDATGIINRRGKNRRPDERVQFITAPEGGMHPGKPDWWVSKEDVMFEPEKHKGHYLSTMVDKTELCEVPVIGEKVPPPPEIAELVESNDDCCVPPENRYKYKVMKVFMRFDDCTLELSFTIDKDMVLDSVETDNVHDFSLIVNGEVMSLDNEIKFLKDDEITVKITRDDLHSESGVVLIGYDPETVIDLENIPESSLDEQIEEEHILINPNEDEEQL